MDATDAILGIKSVIRQLKKMNGKPSKVSGIQGSTVTAEELTSVVKKSFPGLDITDLDLNDPINSIIELTGLTKNIKVRAIVEEVEDMMS